MFDLMNTEIKKDTRKRNEYGIAYKMTSQQKQISFLNKYFIFKKIRNVDINDIKTNLTKIDKYEEEKNITKVETELEKGKYGYLGFFSENYANGIIHVTE